jgi:UDP-N-acetylglucosamine--dolichyl-phosphate N-acetylglucosaminephosphotransferase
LPKLNPKTGLLEPSVVSFKPSDLSPVGLAIVNTLASLGLTTYRKWEDSDGVTQVEVSNYTLINLFIKLLGPAHEGTLCVRVLTFQVFCSCVAFFIRYQLAHLVYDN